MGHILCMHFDEQIPSETLLRLKHVTLRAFAYRSGSFHLPLAMTYIGYTRLRGLICITPKILLAYKLVTPMMTSRTYSTTASTLNN